MCFLPEFSFDFNQHSPRDIKCLIIGEGNLVLNISLDGTWVRIYGCLTTNDNQLFLFYKTIFLKWKLVHRTYFVDVQKIFIRSPSPLITQ